jgi:hypothetical protein
MPRDTWQKGVSSGDPNDPNPTPRSITVGDKTKTSGPNGLKGVCG